MSKHRKQGVGRGKATYFIDINFWQGTKTILVLLAYVWSGLNQPSKANNMTQNYTNSSRIAHLTVQGECPAILTKVSVEHIATESKTTILPKGKKKLLVPLSTYKRSQNKVNYQN